MPTKAAAPMPPIRSTNPIRRRGATLVQSAVDADIAQLEALLHHKRKVEQVKAMLAINEDTYHRRRALLEDDLRQAQTALDAAVAAVESAQ
jgi:hypothetical protein